ncbi:hypothetical protein GCM10027275_50610 [Rhabdobacter roseus]|uniref:Uncharacterized protein n=1 Tax=Rhabdobacter roseus TaxID=1655419 RepID=A0A840TV59_9BACT|nr:hypothetical protein [Rhabdobacter roseus]MBB5287134.1 hypothetical protein [Rhabdobacter roseus]
MQADGLHRAAALLSNTLHEYRPDDVAGVKPVIEQILAKREEWKRVMLQVEHVKKTGKLPDPVQVPSSVPPANGLAELKLELARINVNISKTKKKLEQNPEHKKAQHWAADLDKLEALKDDLKTQIVALTYATT